MNPDTFDHGVDAILQIGARRGRDLHSHLSSSVKRVVLVEGSPVGARALSRIEPSDQRIEIVEAVVSADARPAVFHSFNLERLNGLQGLDAYTENYPGLRQLGSFDVKTKPIGELMGDVAFDRFDTNGLILEAPGEELLILRALLEGEWSDIFTSMVVRMSGPCNGVANYLCDAGFVVQKSEKYASDVVKALRLHSGASAMELRSLHAEEKRLKSRVGDLEAEKAALTSQFADFEAEVKKLKDEIVHLQAELKKARSDKSEFERQSKGMREDVVRLETHLDVLKGLSLVVE